MMESTIQFCWQERAIATRFRVGVSLHSHTRYSEESLDVVPRYAGKIPLLTRSVRGRVRKFGDGQDQDFDFSRGFWTSPVSALQACSLERRQIEETLQLPALVSLTDHDDIRAGSRLRVLEQFRDLPISTEWTVPFGPTFFHIGIHSLPAAAASEVMCRLKQFTSAPDEGQLATLLNDLNAFPDVLLVLNHPLWEEKEIGIAEHVETLNRLLESHGRSIHALELNGLRSWKENAEVIRLGRNIGLPPISGGDRHGLEPNAILNLSEATCFAEFVHEVRYKHQSHILFMQQFKEPLRLRIVQTIVDIVKDCPDEAEGRRTWSDRIYFRPGSSDQALPLSALWNSGEPFVINAVVRTLRLAEFRGVRSALRLALHDKSFWPDQEAAI
jgi:hypothetical protein